MKRSSLKRKTSLKRTAWRANNPPWRREDKLLPGARGWTQRVFVLYGRQCVVCGRRATQAHHAVPRQAILAACHLSDEERVALAYDARNGVPVCVDCHAAHEAASQRIAFVRLPADVVQWALEHGFRRRIMNRKIYP